MRRQVNSRARWAQQVHRQVNSMARWAQQVHKLVIQAVGSGVSNWRLACQEGHPDASWARPLRSQEKPAPDFKVKVVAS